MKKQMVSLVFILAAVLFLSLPNLVFAYYTGLPLVSGSVWEFGSNGLWQSSALTQEELRLISDGNSLTGIRTLSSSVYVRQDLGWTVIYSPWVEVAFDASRLTVRNEDLIVKASAYTTNTVVYLDGTSYPTDALAPHDSRIYQLLPPIGVYGRNNNPLAPSFGILSGPWDTAISQDSPAYALSRSSLYPRGDDISPENLLWWRIGSSQGLYGGMLPGAVATFQLTLNEISLSGDITPVPLPGSLLLFGSGFLGLLGWRFRKS